MQDQNEWPHHTVTIAKGCNVLTSEKKVSSFLTCGVSKLPQHLLHVHCFESTNFSTQCFWHATWTDSILAPSAFGLAPIAFHTCKPCMLHGHVAFGMTYLLPICSCAPTFLPLRCNHTMGNELSEWFLHGNPKQISMLYIQPNPMDLLYVVARIIIIAIKCKNHAPYSCQDNHYSHQMQKIMHHSDEICYFIFFLQQVFVPTKTLYVKGFQ
jgi:hypothetical protein